MKKKTLVVVSFYSAIFLALSFLNLSLFDYAYDDAYIHFRIAENFLVHGKPYYNVDERLMASSSPGWTIVLLVLFFLAGVKLKAVSLLNAAATALAVYVYARVLDETAQARKFSNDLLVALVMLPILVYSDIGLMETPLALLILGVGVLLYLRKNSLSFLFFGMCVFFRLELAVFLLLFLAYNVRSRTVPVWRSCLNVLLGLAPFVVYEYAFFGTVIPQPVRAKSIVYSLNSLQVVIDALPDGLFVGGIAGRAVEIYLLLFLLYAVSRDIRKPGRGANDSVVVLFAFGGAAVLMSYVLARTLVFGWYIPLFAAPLFISFLAYAVNKKSLAFGAALALTLLPYGAGFVKTVDVSRRLYVEYPGCTLMSAEVGGLGFGFKGKVYDGAGLVSGGALKYHPMRVPQERVNGVVGAVPPGYVEEIGPDIIVGYDVFVDAIKKSKIAQNYIIIKNDIYTSDDMRIAHDKNIWGSGSLNIFIRRDKYRK
jgi:hypothetical protein